MADPLNKFLMYVVEHPVMRQESREAQLDASAVQDVTDEIRKISDDTRSDAQRLAPFFAQGLRLAQKGPLVVDDTTPEGNGIAEAFARYLVAPGLATSQSTPIGDSNFRYTFDVDWPKLQQIAQRADIDLDQALASESEAR